MTNWSAMPIPKWSRCGNGITRRSSNIAPSPYDVYQSLYGDYFGRIYGLYAFLRDWKAISRRTLKYLLAEDRKGMTAAEIAASDKRLGELEKREFRLARRGILYAFSPTYSPRKVRIPAGRGRVCAKA